MTQKVFPADPVGASQAPLPPTLLWALRSPCSKGCRYCYFGLLEDHKVVPVTEVGRLSHLHRTDLNPAQVLAFARTLPRSRVRRVFLAGGEPLIWPPILPLIKILKEGGLQVIVCTEGTPLNRPDIAEALVELGVDAVSVSLDSVDPDYNDRLRPSRNGKDGWAEVISGITKLIAARDSHHDGTRQADGPVRPDGQARPRVGIYSVITRENLADIQAVPALAQQLGCDYVVPQPLSLDAGHDLYPMTLSVGHAPDVLNHFAAVSAHPSVHLPAAPYPQHVATAISAPFATVTGCFGGRSLYFAQPDGMLWDCPSSHRIAATPSHQHRTIRDGDAAILFGTATPGCGDCTLFSTDCVQMWPLMDFSAIIGDNH
ncbi:radical SAM protein [Sphaerisporangium sp. NPDC051017]|uniref:radical SAM protein n=1 Tax=Sphaerisporangium sp. NPDC051017 TaxID=3154636 RepID=UPI003415956B